METDNSANHELECRVCRIGGDNERPLFTPCKCSGSIGSVHQDCLEAWLNHSKKDTCELCGVKYEFAPQYAADTPKIIPPGVFLTSIFKLTILKALPFSIRVVLALIIWLILVPLGTSLAYCTCMRRSLALTSFIGKSGLSFAHMSWRGVLSSVFSQIGSTVCYGIVIDAVMALSMLIIMSFADFLRFHWAAGNQNNNNNNNNNVNNNNIPENNQPANPQNEPVPNAENEPVAVNIPNENNVNLQWNRRQLRRRINRAVVNRLPEHENNHDADFEEFEQFLRENERIYTQHRANFPAQDPEEQFENHDHDQEEPKNNESSEPLTFVDSRDQHDLRKVSASESSSNNPQNYSPNYLINDEEDRIFQDLLAKEWKDSMSTTLGEQPSPQNSPEKMHDITAAFSFEQKDIEERKISGDVSISEESDSSDDYSSSNEDDEDEDDELENLLGMEGDDDENDSETDSDDSDEFPGFDMQPPGNDPDFLGLPGENLVGDQVPGLNVPNAQNQQDNIRGANFGGLNNDGLENQDVGIEIRVALFELLGLEGPLYVMFRNAAWLLAFSSVYITVLAFFPYVIGSIMIKLLRTKFRFVLLSLLKIDYLNILPALKEVAVLSADKNPPLQFLDLIYIALGYGTICFSVFFVDLLFYGINKIFAASVGPQGLLHTISLNVSQLSLIVKVGLLLVVRIFLLPITLGSAILVILSHHVISYNHDEWISFLTFNSVGVYALAWVVGITFMLSVTISVLQLREVLHPGIFGKLIKPQEAHADLITSLITENGVIHTRRIIVSCCVYALLLGLLVFSPILFYEKMNKFLHWDIFNFHFWYFVPQLQIPIELLLGHILFLSVVDKNKDVIGHLQHYWLVYICEKLDLTRFLLPLPIIGKKPTKKFNADMKTPIVGSSPQLSRSKHEGTPPGGEETEGKSNEEDEVGPPMLRPPPGWDIRSSQKSTRWAWANETPSALEKNVAPRITPSKWFLKTLALLAISFTLLHAITLMIFIVPLTLGRNLFRVLYIPKFYIHDPLCFVVGSYVLAKLMTFTYRMLFHPNLINNHHLKNHPLLLTLKYMYIRGKCSFNYVFTGVLILIKKCMIYVVIGILLHVLSKLWNQDVYYAQPYSHLLSFPTTFKPSPQDSLLMDQARQQTFLQDYSLFYVTLSYQTLWRNSSYLFQRILSFMPTGFVLLECLLYALMSERIGMRIIRYFGIESLQSWLIDCQLAMNQLIFLVKTAINQHNQIMNPNLNQLVIPAAERMRQLEQLQQFQQLLRQRHGRHPRNHRHHRARDNNLQNNHNLPAEEHENAEPQPTDNLPEAPVNNNPQTNQINHGGPGHNSNNNSHNNNNNNNNSNNNNSNHNHSNSAQKLETQIIQQMNHLYNFFYYPFFHEIVLKGFCCFILIPTIILSNQPLLQLFRLVPFYEWTGFPLPTAASIAENPAIPYLFVFRIQWTIMRFFIVLYFATILFPFAIKPVVSSFSLLHKKIRDENYLVGRILLNSAERVSTL